MKKLFSILFVLLFAAAVHAEVKVKVKEITYIDGLKENQVIGYGLVVGLAGTGDSKVDVTKSSLKNLLKNLGLEEKDLKSSKNVAAVLITAQLPPFVRVGDRVDVTVSSIGDAVSLEGGTLVQSQLRGADDKVYLVAQGPVSTTKANRKLGKTVKTTASVPRAGIVENPVEAQFVVNGAISLVLKEWDFAVADEILKGIADAYPQSNPELDQSGKIRLTVPTDVKLSEFLAAIQGLEVSPDSRARVVINEKDGTIVTGGDVKLSEALVSKEGITIKVDGQDRPAGAVLMKDSPSVKELVEALNAVGLPTSDVIAILKALKDSGALHAELIVK